MVGWRIKKGKQADNIERGTEEEEEEEDDAMKQQRKGTRYLHVTEPHL